MSYRDPLRKRNARYLGKSTLSVSPSSCNPSFCIRVCTDEKTRVATQELCLIPNAFSTKRLDSVLKEIENMPSQWWVRWHKDSHWAANENIAWRKEMPMFKEIQYSLQEMLSVHINASRLNRYVGGQDHKLFHRDASAIVPSIAKKQNTSIVLSLGEDRDVFFYDLDNKTTVSVRVTHGMVYAFGYDLNLNWAHGLPQDNHTGIRYSLAFWGWGD